MMMSLTINNGEYCLEFSKKIADVVFDLAIALGTLGILLSLFAIMLPESTNNLSFVLYISCLSDSQHYTNPVSNYRADSSRGD